MPFIGTFRYTGTRAICDRRCRDLPLRCRSALSLSVAERAAEAFLVACGRFLQPEAAGRDLGGPRVDRDQLARERLEIAKTAVERAAADEQTGTGLLRGIPGADVEQKRDAKHAPGDDDR